MSYISTYIWRWVLLLEEPCQKNLWQSSLEGFRIRNETGFSVNKSKSSWGVISEVLGNSKSVRNIGDLIIDHDKCNDNSIKAHHASEFFTTIGHIWERLFFDDDSILSYLTSNVNSAFSFEQAISQQLELFVKTFQNTSPVHDDLCISIYKENLDSLGEILLEICIKS